MSDLSNSRDKSGQVPPLSGRASLRDRVREAARQTESQIIMDALEKHRWNRRRTAEALRISYRSLMYKMKYCNLRDGGAADKPAAN